MSDAMVTSGLIALIFGALFWQQYNGNGRGAVPCLVVASWAAVAFICYAVKDIGGAPVAWTLGALLLIGSAVVAKKWRKA